MFAGFAASSPEKRVKSGASMGDDVPTLPVLRGKWVTDVFVEIGFHFCKVVGLIKNADYFSLAGLSDPWRGMPVKNEKARSLILGFSSGGSLFSSPDISLSQRSSTFPLPWLKARSRPPVTATVMDTPCSINRWRLRTWDAARSPFTIKAG